MHATDERDHSEGGLPLYEQMHGQASAICHTTFELTAFSYFIITTFPCRNYDRKKSRALKRPGYNQVTVPKGPESGGKYRGFAPGLTADG